MLASSSPTPFPIPFASSAGAGYIRTIPTASQISITPGAASLTDGFPPLNFLPITAGGVPPFGQDMNGVINEITAAIQWQQAGGLPVYDSTFQTAIGGYPNGAMIKMAAANGFWISTVDNNLTDPDTGGAGWISTIQQLNFISLTSTGNFTTPANITTATVFEITLVGGGGGGGSSNVLNTVAQGGGAGAAAKFLISGLAPNTSYAVTIGAAGAAGAGGTSGGTGGSTQITINGVVYSCAGGILGNGTSSSVVNICATQGSVSSTITSLTNKTIIYQVNSGVGITVSSQYSGCNGAALPGYGTGGFGGRTGSAPGNIAIGFGAGGGAGVADTGSGAAGAPGLFEARWVA